MKWNNFTQACGKLSSTLHYSVQWGVDNIMLCKWQVEWTWRFKVRASRLMKGHILELIWLPLWFSSIRTAYQFYLMVMHSGAQKCQRIAGERYLVKCDSPMSQHLGSSEAFFNIKYKQVTSGNHLGASRPKHEYLSSRHSKLMFSSWSSCLWEAVSVGTW